MQFILDFSVGQFTASYLQELCIEFNKVCRLLCQCNKARYKADPVEKYATYFMAMIDGVFCLDAHVIHKLKTHQSSQLSK